MQTAASPNDLFRLPDGGRGYELIDGRFVERLTSVKSSLTTGQLLCLLMDHTDRHQPAWVMANCSYQCFAAAPNRVLRPSVSLIFAGRISDREAAAGHCPVVPDLVAEVFGRTETDRTRRVAMWLDAGVKVVWGVSVSHRRAWAFDRNAVVIEYGETATLEEPALLPGFACPVAELFRLPGTP